MASLTIRNIPDDVKLRLRQRAAANGRSMEEEGRRLILAAVDQQSGSSRVHDAGARYRSEPAIDAGSERFEDSWVAELIRIANGAGDGVFESKPQPLREFDL